MLPELRDILLPYITIGGVDRHELEAIAVGIIEVGALWRRKQLQIAGQALSLLAKGERHLDVGIARGNHHAASRMQAWHRSKIHGSGNGMPQPDISPKIVNATR